MGAISSGRGGGGPAASDDDGGGGGKSEEGEGSGTSNPCSVIQSSTWAIVMSKQSRTALGAAGDNKKRPSCVKSRPLSRGFN